MGSVLYYSGRCENSLALLQQVSGTGMAGKIHFVSVDDRVVVDGATYAMTARGKRVLMPSAVDRVPALLLLNRGNQILFGEDITKYLEPHQLDMKRAATSPAGVPDPYDVRASSSGGFGVASDSYSFWDQSSDEMAAKGGGGMRQQWHYATPADSYTIETPPDTYEPDKVGTKDMERMAEERQLG